MYYMIGIQVHMCSDTKFDNLFDMYCMIDRLYYMLGKLDMFGKSHHTLFDRLYYMLGKLDMFDKFSDTLLHMYYNSDIFGTDLDNQIHMFLDIAPGKHYHSGQRLGYALNLYIQNFDF